MEIDLFCANPDAYLRQEHNFSVSTATTSLICKLEEVSKELKLDNRVTTQPENYRADLDLNDINLFINLGDLFTTEKDLIYCIHFNKSRRLLEVLLKNRHVDISHLREREDTLFKLRKFNSYLNTILSDQAKTYGLEYSSKLNDVIAPKTLEEKV